MSSNREIKLSSIMEPIFEAKDSITGPEYINTYSPNENHILFSSFDGNLILYNCDRKTNDFSSKIELTTKNLTPIISMTYNSSQKAIIFLDACDYIHYDNLEDTSHHRCIKINLPDLIESITYLANNKYFIKTDSYINYIYEIIPSAQNEGPQLIVKPIIKYTFPAKPTSFFKTDTHFYIGCQRGIYRINLKNFHTQTPKILYELNLVNNKNISDMNEGLVTSMFYFDPNCLCYKIENDIDSNNNMIKYVLNKDNNYNNSSNNFVSSEKIEDLEEYSEDDSESDEDNSDELLILGNNLGKVEVIPMDNMDKKYSFKCFVNNDYYVAVTAITYDNLRQNIYIGSNDGGLYGLNVANKKKIFYNQKFRGGIYGMVYIPKLDSIVFSVTDFEDEIFSDENYLDIKKLEKKRISKKILEENEDFDKNEKENKIYMVNDIDGFIKYFNKK